MTAVSPIVPATRHLCALLALVSVVCGVAEQSARAAATGGGGAEDCSNGIDDNGNGVVDCAETKQCRTDPACVEDGDRCADGLDNDFDGLKDCADPACATAAACMEVGDSCADGIDNDGDGALDCADDECATSLLCSDQVCLELGAAEVQFFLVVELAGGEIKSARCRTSAGATTCDTAGTGANGRPLLVLGPPMCGGTP